MTALREISNLYGMNVDFTPDLQAKLSRMAVERGNNENALVQEAVERFVNHDAEAFSFENVRAAAAIRELRKDVTLGGLKLKDLISEGRA